MPLYRLSHAAELLGVSDDTLRRWIDAGRLTATVDDVGRQAVEGAELANFAQAVAEAHPRGSSEVVVAHSMRNRFPGLVTSVVKDTVMAQVEIQAGPHRIVSLMSREAADELGLEPGVLAVAAVKSTNVSIEIPGAR
jgi:molybdopterin-binding protein